MRAKQWTHGKMMLMVPFAITHAVAYNKGGTHDYGWDDLQFIKDYKEQHEGNPPGIMCGIFFLVPGCVSSMFMRNMEFTRSPSSSTTSRARSPSSSSVLSRLPPRPARARRRGNARSASSRYAAPLTRLLYVGQAVRGAGYFASVNLVNFKYHDAPNRGASKSG